MDRCVPDPKTMSPSELSECFLSMCAKRVLLECIDIGATAYAKFRIELKKQNGKKYYTPMQYSTASFIVVAFLTPKRFRDCSFLSCRCTEDNNYVMNTTLTPPTELKDDIFGANVSRKKLLGKFDLEVLFVDAEKIGDIELVSNYKDNINVRLGDFSDSACLKEKVKRAEKWFGKINWPPAHRLVHCTERAYAGIIVLQKRKLKLVHGLHPITAQSTFIFQQKVESIIYVLKNGLLTYQFLILSREQIVLLLMQFKNSFAEQTTRNTYNMFEFFTNDGVRIITKLQLHSQNSADIIADTIRKFQWEKLTTWYVVTVYVIDIPANGDPNLARTHFDIIRKRLERADMSYDCAMQYTKENERAIMLQREFFTNVTLEECKAVFGNLCECKNIHVSSYCNLQMLFHKKTRKFLIHSWSIGLSNLCIKLYEKEHDSYDLYAKIAHAICNNFLDEFRVDSNLLCELKVGGRMYSTQLRHHSNVNQQFLEDELFGHVEVVELHKEINVTVYVVDILSFETNANAHECLRNLRDQVAKGNGSSIIIPAEPKISTKPITIPRKPKKCTTRFTLNPQPEPHAQDVVGKAPKILESNYFIADSSLAKKALMERLTIRDGYVIHRTNVSMNTAKSRILSLHVQLDPTFYTDLLDSSLLMADILLDIVDYNETFLFYQKKKKITLRLHTRRFDLLVMVLATDEDRNSNNLINELSRCEAIDFTEQFFLDVQYRLM